MKGVLNACLLLLPLLLVLQPLATPNNGSLSRAVCIQPFQKWQWLQVHGDSDSHKLWLSRQRCYC